MRAAAGRKLYRTVEVGCSLEVHLIPRFAPLGKARTLCGLGGPLGGPLRNTAKAATCSRCQDVEALDP